MVDTRLLDVTEHASVEHFVTEVIALHGRIDELVNNAGVMPLSRMDVPQVAEWERTMDVNVMGVLHGIAAVLPRMQGQGSGHIVNVTSIGAHRSYPGAGVYCASKFAVWATGDALRQEWVDENIRMTTVSPGTTESELADHITDPAATEAMRAVRATAIAPEAIADAIAYAIAQPAAVSISELIVRPTRSPDWVPGAPNRRAYRDFPPDIQGAARSSNLKRPKNNRSSALGSIGTRDGKTLLSPPPPPRSRSRRHAQPHLPGRLWLAGPHRRSPLGR